MLVFIAKRFGQMLFTMIGVSILVFLLLEIDVEGVAVGVLGPYSSEEQRMLWLEQHGYYEPAWFRYFSWLMKFATLDLGHSIRFNTPVNDLLWGRLWNTAILGFWAMAVIIPFSLILGVLAGMKEGSIQDRVISITSIITTSVPEFATTVLFSAVFVFGFKLLPGTSPMTDGFEWKQMILPVLVLATYDFGYVTRMTRASMAEVMTTPYIRSAVLKGLPYKVVIMKHALRNALIAPFTIILLQVNWLLNGVIVVEFFFAYKGFGALLLEASLNQDIMLIEACAMVAVFVAVATQVLADIGYMFLNPRIRFK
jgi:peptide/nickel transport system permease protein